MQPVITSTVLIDQLLEIQGHVFKSQWDTALIAAACNQCVARRKEEVLEQALPWSPAVEQLYHVSAQLAEQWSITSDAQSKLRTIRRTLHEMSDVSDRLAGAANGEVAAALRLQDTKRHLTESVEELAQACASLSSQLHELEKQVNTTVVC